MGSNKFKIGVVSCSGENCLGGTISRLATRKMLDEIRPDETITICLPLFLAGGEEERGFAEAYPTIAVDGCDKCCAKIATEKYSGKVSDTVVISDIIGKDVAEGDILSTRNLTEEHKEMVDKVAKEIRIKFEKIYNDYIKKQSMNLLNNTDNKSGGCG
ncbi:DGC domain protein [Clostridium tepidiprofundi DSM 19306]|uniref:DGC domain protein n=1 Tax=Clostridium tepidiprofundi DSM 19306 TaxID=1121338 RepID=A0A151B5S7_9CLOT|nr:putative zinc-binding protein [Clostridium tepidiprofundi]KYH35275.1 DGC domain protein [Clostridium tepidiprofundi DSM 19306]